MRRNVWLKWDSESDKLMLSYLLTNAQSFVARYPDQLKELHEIINGFKLSWAEDMRFTEPTPADKGLSMWRDNMELAEAAIVERLGPGAPEGQRRG